MEGTAISAQASQGKQQRRMEETLPHWQHLSAGQQRQTVLTLAAMLTRQLPSHQERREVSYEAAS